MLKTMDLKQQEEQAPNPSMQMASIFEGLAEAWRMLRTGAINLPLPENVIILPMTELRGRPRAKTLGYFAPSRWATNGKGIHQVALHPGLFHSAEDALLVLLHEAVHGLLLDKNYGCSKNGYYHRAEYRNRCIALGLRCEFTDTRHGWNHTRWPKAGVPAQYQDVITLLQTRLAMAAKNAVKVSDHDGAPLPAGGRIVLVCACERRIYVSRGNALSGGIRCEQCGELFA